MSSRPTGTLFGLLGDDKQNTPEGEGGLVLSSLWFGHDVCQFGVLFPSTLMVSIREHPFS